ncbi:cardiolipin synthase [Shewanella sp. KCT]|uniref:cardiolipin synthase n=1 Tax=Shewanella sp. KCT TaxID=2569535 RepID=UPI001181F275|nr:cardiolipin synthase [Shewanella sp. KCT]TVP16287.1 cardiolipin synthase A [Shewanella sp. KCT]
MENVHQILAIVGVFIYWLFLGAIALRLVIKRRTIGVSFSWILVIYFLPLVGIIAYILFGELHLGQTRASRSKSMFKPYGQWFAALYQHPLHTPERQSDHAKAISQLCDTQLGIPSLSGNQLCLQHTPSSILNSIIQDIEAAKENIVMEFYIWHPGGLADDVAKAVIKASKRGVAVKLLLDAAGSRTFFNSPWPTLLRAAGVEISQALSVSPLRMFFRRLDLRLHRKIVVIDNHIAYTGSMNLVDPKYFKQGEGVGQWIDVMVRMVGPAVPLVNTVAAWDWEVETSERYLPEPPGIPEKPYASSHEISYEISCEPSGEVRREADSLIQVIPSGPGMPEEVIHQVLLQSLYQACRKIVITTPYFVPSENLLDALVTAAARGVDVNIIIPQKNDSTMVKWASRSFFAELLKAGVKIHRFRGGLLHTKSVLIDDEHCLIGTVNMDMRSLWLNFELTLAVDDKTFAEELRLLQQGYIDNAEQLEYKRWQSRPLYQRVIEHLFYLFSPLL